MPNIYGNNTITERETEGAMTNIYGNNTVTEREIEGAMTNIYGNTVTDSASASAHTPAKKTCAKTSVMKIWI
jgi:hypothetical protein